MLKKNFGKYKLYFWGNVISTGIFFCFSTLFLNQEFMDGNTIDSMISSNVILPSMLMAFFMIFFLPLSYHVFWNSRQREYGIFLTLGMCRKEAARNILLESLLVSTVSLLSALILGSFCSIGFYGFLGHILRINNWSWTLPLNAYVLTTVFYMSIVIIAALFYSLKMAVKKISGMLKNQEKEEKTGFLIAYFKRVFPERMNRGLIKLSFLSKHKREWNLRHFLGSIMFMCILCFISLSICIYGGFQKDAEEYAPYDLCYAGLYGYNQISPDETTALLEKEQVRVDAVYQLNFFRDSVYNYVSVSEANHKLNTDYNVEQGYFLNVFQFATNDGYEHNMSPVNSITINGSKDCILHSCGSDVKILWNQNPAFAERTVILNDNDFQRLYNNTNYWQGTINLFTFHDWRHSKNGVVSVQNYLQKQNNLTDADQKAVAVSSKIGDYERASQSGSVLWLFMSFVVVLLLSAILISIHFRIIGEKDENAKRANSLYYLGCMKKELCEILLFKNRMRFMIPIVCGSMISVLPSYYLNQTYHFGIWGIIVSILFGIIIGSVVWYCMKFYSEKELHSLIKY